MGPTSFEGGLERFRFGSIELQTSKTLVFGSKKGVDSRKPSSPGIWKWKEVKRDREAKCERKRRDNERDKRKQKDTARFVGCDMKDVNDGRERRGRRGNKLALYSCLSASLGGSKFYRMEISS